MSMPTSVPIRDLWPTQQMIHFCSWIGLHIPWQWRLLAWSLAKKIYHVDICSTADCRTCGGSSWLGTPPVRKSEAPFHAPVGPHSGAAGTSNGGISWRSASVLSTHSAIFASGSLRSYIRALARHKRRERRHASGECT